MTWVAVGVGAAVGAAGGAIYGSQKGGDAVWKDALIGGLGGATLGAGGEAFFGAGTALEGALAPAAVETAAPVVAEGGLAAIPGVTPAAGVFPSSVPATLQMSVPGATVGGEGIGALSSGQLLGGTAGSSVFGTTGGTSLLGPGAGVIEGVTPTAAAPVTSMAPTVASTAPTVSAAPAVTPAAPAAVTPPAVTPPATTPPPKVPPSFLTEYGKPLAIGAATLGLGAALKSDSNKYGTPPTETYNGPLSKIQYDPEKFKYQAPQPNVYQARYGYAEGGIAALAGGGNPTDPMNNPIYPQSQQVQTEFATATQMPNSMKSAIAADYDARTNPQTGAELPLGMASGGVARYAEGGMSISSLGQLMSGQNNPNILSQYAGSQLTGQLGNNAAGTATAPTGPISMPSGFDFEGDTLARIDRMIGSGINPFAQETTKTITNPTPAAQTSWGQGAQGYASLSGGSGGSSNAGAGSSTYGNNGVFPLQGQYGIVKMAQGGVSGLGYYSDGGQMLRGPGDGMSDSIPGNIAGKQPARLADGEFVVPADVVSHLGNGSTDAGAKQLYSMMNKVRKARTGTPKQGKQINPKKYMPA